MTLEQRGIWMELAAYMDSGGVYMTIPHREDMWKLYCDLASKTGHDLGVMRDIVAVVLAND